MSGPSVSVGSPVPTVLIYRDQLGRPAETFLLSQGERLRSFSAVYVGWHMLPGLEYPASRTVILGSAGDAHSPGEIAFKALRLVPPSVRRLSGYRPVLLHAHHGSDGIRAMDIARTLRVPLVTTFHGSDALVSDEWARRQYPALRSYVKRRPELQERGALFIAVSKFVRDALLDRGYPTDRVIVHYIGVDTEFFAPRTCADGRDFVLFVGTLVENKGCMDLLRAMVSVQSRHPEARLVVVGDGPLKSQLIDSSRSLGVQAEFLGVQPPAVVRDLMASARVFCVPSVPVSSGGSEGFGLVFLEAQASGTPVVSYTTGGIPEAIEAGETGFLCAPGDWAALADNIGRFYAASDLWQRFSSAARERVVTRFDVRSQTAVLEQLYARTIEAFDQGRRASNRRSAPV